MALADFIKKNFINKTLCFFYGETAETITYDQIWSNNKEYLCGVVADAEDGVIVVDLLSGPRVYINSEEVTLFWEPGFDLHRAIDTSITVKPMGGKRDDDIVPTAKRLATRR